MKESRVSKVANLILSTGKLKVFEDLKYLCDFTGKTVAFADELWEELLSNEALYQEFTYYIENHCFKDEMAVCGYSLSDLYVLMLGNYNLLCDCGKNTAECNKESMVLESFMAMKRLIRDPETFVKRFDEGRGMDKFVQ